MDPKSVKQFDVTRPTEALVSYSIYLKLLVRCGVKASPVHGWVA